MTIDQFSKHIVGYFSRSLTTLALLFPFRIREQRTDVVVDATLFSDGGIVAILVLAGNTTPLHTLKEFDSQILESIRTVIPGAFRGVGSLDNVGDERIVQLALNVADRGVLA